MRAEASTVAARTGDLAGVERCLRRALRRGELSLAALREHYGLRPPQGLAAMPQLEISDLDSAQIEQLAYDTSWLDRAENLLLFGPSGVGKTHLAAGISRSLIGLDRSARFYSAT